MKEFRAGDALANAHLRVVVGGKPASGKTSFAATAPYPLFFGDAQEGGFETLKTMAKNPKRRSFWWDPKFEPGEWAKESMLDNNTAIDKLRAMHMAKKCPYQTLVFDSLSIYGQRVLRDLKAKDSAQDNRQRYGDLNDAVSYLIGAIHSLPMHVVWLCHVTDDYQLAISGKATAATWAYMSHKWLIRADVQAGKATNYQLHTQPFRTATWLGGRGEPLPDPMLPSFKCLFPLLGLPGTPVSPAVPDYMGQAYPDGAAY